MATRKMLTGNYAAAHGARLSRAEVVPFYPITPQTPIMEKMAEFVENGQLFAEFVPAESEHSAMAIAIAAQATGARTFTASSSQGLLYMHENLFVASGLRLPIVMAMVNRGIGAPLTICPDLGDSLDQRDTGWIQIYVESAQEAHDMIIQAYRIGEDTRVLLPVAVCFEGMIVSHYAEPVEILDQDQVDAFLPSYRPEHVILDPDRPMSIHQLLLDDTYFTEYRYQQEIAMENAREVIQEVDQSFRELFDRGYGGLFLAEMMDDAEIAILTVGSLASTVREAIDHLRKEMGIPIGLIKLRAVRPFPDEMLTECLKNLKAVGVLERDVSVGAAGIIYTEVSRCLGRMEKRPLLINYILGLGGRDVTSEDVRGISLDLFSERYADVVPDPVRWFQVRGLQ